jgi:hypothetical protein
MLSHSEPLLVVAGPLLAAGEGVVTLIVIALTVASWIVNMVSQYSQTKPQPVVRPRGNRPPERDSDQERSQRGNAQKKRSQPETRPQGQKKPPKPPPPRRPVAPAESMPSDQEQPRRPLGGAISGRHLETQSLGQGVRESVRDHMVDHTLAKTVAQDMKQTVGAAVQEHLGAFSTGAAPAAPGLVEFGRSSADTVAGMFRNPETLRQTMLANIVLSKPIALAKRKPGAL